MFRKLFAASLLVLVLSPYTAPFQVINAHDPARAIVSIEPRTPVRSDDDSRPITISPSGATLSTSTGSAPASFAPQSPSTNRLSGYWPSATILRV